GDERVFVGAGDGDGDVLGGEAAVVVGNLDAVGLDDGLAGGEEVDGAVGDGEVPGDTAAEAVHRVGDGAGGERSELHAAGIGRGDEGGRGGVGVGEIDVGERHRAAIGERDGGVFGDRAVGVRGDERVFVGAGDGDGDVLGGEAAVVVGNLDAVGLDDGLAGGEEVDGAVGDGEVPGDTAAEAVHRVGDGAGGERSELHAAGIGRGDEGGRGGVGVGEIDVGERHRAAIGERDGGVFGDRAVGVRGDERVFVGAGDGDGDVLGGEAAVVVGNLDAVGLDDGLAGGEEVDGAVGDGEVPGDTAAEAVHRVGDGAGGERSELHAAGIGRGDEGGRGGVGVGEIDVGERHRAAIGERDGGVFGDRAVGVRGDERVFVGAGDGDGDVLGGEAAVVVGNLDAVGLDDGLAGGEEVDGAVGDGEVPGDTAAEAVHRVGDGAGGERSELHAAG